MSKLQYLSDVMAQKRNERDAEAVRWAKEDNPDKFEEIKNDNILNYIKKVALSFDGGTHHHVAEIMKRVYGDTYKCSVEHRGNEWFRFVGCIWEPVPQGIELKRQMSDRIAELVSDSRTAFRTLLNSKRTNIEGGFLADDEKDDDKKLNKFLKLQACNATYHAIEQDCQFSLFVTIVGFCVCNEAERLAIIVTDFR
jgi:hypothetical protein